MRQGLLRFVVTYMVAVVVLAPRPAQAADPPAPDPPAPDPRATEEDPTVLAARREFTDGAALVRRERWGEALAAFERAAKLKAHAITTYNIGQCERAMGQYTRARRALVVALKQNEDAGRTELAESIELEARAILGEIDKILPRVNVTLRPTDSAVAVDGRPLETVDPSAVVPVFVAGTLPPGPGARLEVMHFQLVTNPGVHVITVSRQGYQDVVVSRTFAPASTSNLSLELDRLPAAIHVTSNLADAIVRVNGADVGNAPVEVSRAAGRYRVLVTREGFLSYDSEVAVRPGERVELAATLREDRPALTQRWWFWTAAGVLVVGAAVGTYLVARSTAEPTRPGTDGGGLGWSLKLP